MILGDEIRPLKHAGQVVNPRFDISRLVVNDDFEEKQNTIKLITKQEENFFTKGYSGYMFANKEINSSIQKYLKDNNIPCLVGVNNWESLQSGDIVEVDENTGIINVLYRANSNDNIIFTTNRCNNNCMFCPDSETVRKNYNDIPLNIIKKMIGLIPKDCRYLCITGGEPTILKFDLMEILEECKRELKNTEFMLLTNGRMFCIDEYTNMFVDKCPDDIVVGIAIHGDTARLHDYCTQVEGSFVQTLVGIKNLLDKKIKVEIRIVINRLNYKQIPNLCRLIANNFPNAMRVSFMGLEMLGNAAKNEEQVWIDYEQIQEKLYEGIYELTRKGIQSNIFNIPLCFLDEKLWQFSVQSISDYKVRYRKECTNCSAKRFCGGFFYSTLSMKNIEVNPIY